MGCQLGNLDGLDQAAERKFWVLLKRELSRDDGAAARSHLEAGRSIYYCDDRFVDEIVRECPDGTKELLEINEVGEIIRTRQWERG